MRRVFVILMAAVATSGLLTPAPVFAQAAAPAPKVTISGLVDFVASAYKNSAPLLDGSDLSKSNDKGAYSRERGVFTFTGEVGRSKGVLALELDLVNGQTARDPGQGGTFTRGPASGDNGSPSFDLDTDVKRVIEVKWLYLETPITGPGALLPFIPVATIGRFGGQPARGHDYKPGVLFTGDFAGINLATNWAPNLRTTLTYVQIAEKLDPVTLPTGVDSEAFLASIELDVFKGLTVKPTYAYVFFSGGSTGATAPFGLEPRGGFDPTGTLPTTGASNNTRHTERHTIGGDVRWVFGPFTVMPTFYYQWGTQQVDPTTNQKRAADVDIRAWYSDLDVTFRTGPLTLEARGVYTPGMSAGQCVQAVAGVCRGGSDITYYQNIHSGSNYMAGWSEIEASGVDYNAKLSQSLAMRLDRNPSYDKYGRIILGLAADYALTPALTFHLLGNAQWTDRAVDVTGVLNSRTGITPAKRDGDEHYLGTELDGGLTYRFAPNMAFDFIGAVLFVGDARNITRAAGEPVREAQDVYRGSARLRLTW